MILSERMGRVLSAVGAILLVAGLFLTWYHISRTGQDTTGFQTFTRLRWLIVFGAIALLISAVVVQTRAVLIARTILGVVLGAFILRRIIDPPDISGISTQFGVFVSLLAAIGAALGGLVDTGRHVVQTYPDVAFWRQPAAHLGPGSAG